MIKITIITVVYNGISYIEETIDSVLNQSYENIEYIIIDGNSNDGTKDVLTKFNNIKSIKIVSDKDNGIYDAMNKGISLATGNWINFMNAGDIFFNNDTLKDIFSLDCSNATIIYGDLMVTYNGFSKIQKATNLVNLKYGMCFSHQSTFFETSFAKRNLYNLKFKLASDFDLIYKAYSADRLFVYRNIIVSNVISNGIADKNRVKTLNEYFEISKKYNSKFILLPIYIKIYIITFLTMVIKNIIPSSLQISIRKQLLF
jgi:glycosyltransferase involved in cell wall biosynthesis